MAAEPHLMRFVWLGDVRVGPWAIFSWTDPEQPPCLSWGAGTTGLQVEQVTAREVDGRWLVNAPEASLTVSPTEGGLRLGTDDVQLCVEPVTAELVNPELVGGEARPMAGLRAELSGVEHATWGTVRVLLASFTDGPSYAVATLRPAKAKGHDKDLVIAALVEGSREATLVEDPRVSVTLDDSGELIRAGMELWLAPEEEGGDQYPHRCAGERFGESVLGSATEGTRNVASRLGWHSRGREGSGPVWSLGRS